MKKIIATYILCSLINFTMSAQSKDEKDVALAVEKLRKAMVAADKATLENLAADQLTYGHSSGLIENKTEFVAEFLDKRTVFLSIELTDQTIKVVDNVALVRHKLTGDSNNNNVPGKVNISVLLIWQKQKGEWKLIARQAVKNPETK